MDSDVPGRQAGGAPLDKLVHRPGVVVEVAACKALVCAVEEREVALFEHHVRNLAPLLMRRVHASWVVRACMDEEDRVRRGTFQRLDEGVEGKTDSLRVIVRVHREGQPDGPADSRLGTRPRGRISGVPS